MNKASQTYEAAHKEERRVRDAKRAIFHPDARAPFDLNTKRRLFEKQTGICPCCCKPLARPDDCDVDHATPLSKGGSHQPSNFILAHKQCNREKHNKTLKEHWDWRFERGLDEEHLGHKLGLV
jgi:5-methylcytosine-specific restriction endonuclease McrA